MNYLVFDLETGTRTEKGRKANPWYNKVVAVGYQKSSGNRVDYVPELLTSQDEFSKVTWKTDFKDMLIGVDVLVGFNIKFDLLYVWGAVQQFIKAGGKVWDCQLVEYMLNGQQKYPALRETAVKYGCSEREKFMEKYWDQGFDTVDIPDKLVVEDVKNDVMDTEAVYLKQLQQVNELGMLALVESENQSLLATTEMEYNGMYIDRNTLKNYQLRLEKELIQEEEKLSKLIQEVWIGTTIEFNSASNDHLSVLFFGGTLKESISEPIIGEDGQIVTIKSGANKGQIKTKKVIRAVNIQGLRLTPKDSWKVKKKGFYSTSEKVLTELSTKTEIATTMVKIREIKKLLSTYYISTEELIYEDACVHAQFNHTATETGRLSCKKPNIQNQPNNQVLEHFKSRF